MRRTLLLLGTMVLALWLACGVALAANIQCQGGPCVGTEQNDRITGSQLDDDIEALGGRDHVTGRMGDDGVDGGAGSDEITGGDGGDFLDGAGGADEIGGGPGTPDGEPRVIYFIGISDPGAGIDVSCQGNQILNGGDGNDRLSGGRDNDLLQGGAGKNVLSGNGADDCLSLNGDENERASGAGGDDLVFAEDGNGDDVFCGAGNDTVFADPEDRVAADCEEEFEDVFGPSSLQEVGATPEAEVNITAP